MGKVATLLERHGYTALFLLLLAVGLGMLFSQAHEKKEPLSIQKVFLEVAGPFQKGISKGLDLVRDIWDRYLFLVHLKEENQLLREIIEEMKEERIRLLEYKAENERLRSLLGFTRRFEDPLLPAEVIAQDTNGWFQTVVVDRGERDGLEEGMAVLSVQGVVGQIMECAHNFSRVLLITDPNNAVAAVVQRSRAKGIVEGTGRNRCRLKYLHRSEDVREGDLVLASGLDGVYPKGVLIGKVVRIETREADLFQRVEVEPSVDFRRLEEVVVLCRKPEVTGAAKR